MRPILFLLCSTSLITAARAEAPNPGEPLPDVLSLGAVTEAALANNPSIREAHAKWKAMQERVPQAAAWEDLKVVGSTRVARFVDVARNSFMDQALRWSRRFLFQDKIGAGNESRRRKHGRRWRRCAGRNWMGWRRRARRISALQKEQALTSERALWDMESTAQEHFADYQMAVADLEAIIGSDPSIFAHTTDTTHPKTK